MGAFSMAVTITDLTGQYSIAIDALVDTGSTLTSIAGDILAQLHIEPQERRRFRLGDDSVTEYPVGFARLSYQGHECAISVAFLPPGAEPLVGATTLESLGLAIDPVSRRLYPVDLLLK